MVKLTHSNSVHWGDLRGDSPPEMIPWTTSLLDRPAYGTLPNVATSQTTTPKLHTSVAVVKIWSCRDSGAIQRTGNASAAEGIVGVKPILSLYFNLKNTTHAACFQCWLPCVSCGIQCAYFFFFFQVLTLCHYAEVEIMCVKPVNPGFREIENGRWCRFHVFSKFTQEKCIGRLTHR